MTLTTVSEPTPGCHPELDQRDLESLLSPVTQTTRVSPGALKASLEDVRRRLETATPGRH